MLTLDSTFNHVNYEDPDINVAIPVFSIHGNHDDPSGAGHLAALDLLQMSGLLNYYGRVPESDNILVKPVLLQKGSTKLALYGMSNVRDERLFRTFRDGNVKFFQPNQQTGDWFNLMSVHQNHHAYTDTGYLPENFLPTFLDLVIWGHEHECLIEPRTNTETNFRVSQPGSSVATSLVAGEAVPKHVALLTITGKDFDLQPIRLKTVRPFKYKEIALSDDKYMRQIAQDHENRSKVHRYLIEVVEAMIVEAQEEWLELQQENGHEPDEDVEPPLPLIRLRVEYSAPEGGKFDIDNPQRFSSRFVGRVANVTDVVQYYRKKRNTTTRRGKNEVDMPETEAISRLNFESVKVDKLVEEFLSAQSLTILPQTNFSDAVVQFVDKDDRTAMVEFVDSSLKHLISEVVEDRDETDENQDIDDDQMFDVIERAKTKLEEGFRRGEIKAKRKGSRKPRPAEWDSDMDGHWEENIASIVRSEDEREDDDDDDAESVASRPTTGRGRGRGRGGKAAAGTTRKTAAATKKAPAKSTARGKKKAVSDDDEEDSDLVMLDDEDSGDDVFVRPSTTKKAPARKAAPSRSTAAKTNGTSKATSSARGGKSTQSQLSFARASNGTGTSSRANGTSDRAAAPKRMQEPSEDEISDDDDAFEPPPPSARTGGRTR